MSGRFRCFCRPDICILCRAAVGCATRINIARGRCWRPMLAADIGTVDLADIKPTSSLYLIYVLIIASTAIVALNYKYIVVLTIFIVLFLLDVALNSCWQKRSTSVYVIPPDLVTAPESNITQTGQKSNSLDSKVAPK